MDKPTKWEDYLHLAEFSYNNGYQASAKLSPLKTFYGRVSWENLVNKVMIGPNQLKEMEQELNKVRQNIK